MRKFFIVFVVAIILYSAAPAEESVIGLMFAFPEEGELLKQKLELTDSVKLAERIFYSGRLAGHQIVLVESGVGLVAAAMTTQLLIDRFKPENILFSGICGAVSSEYRIGDIAVPYKWIIHDFGVYDSSGFRLAQNQDKRFIYYAADPNLLSLAGESAKQNLGFHKIDSRIPAIRFSKIGSSGNSFIDQAQKRQWLKGVGIEIVDMESGAVVQVANANLVPVLVIRSCSDLAGGSGSSTALKELEEFFKVATENSAIFLVEILKRIK